MISEIKIKNSMINNGDYIVLPSTSIKTKWEAFTNVQGTPKTSLSSTINEGLGRGINTGFNNPTISLTGKYAVGDKNITYITDEFEGDGTETSFALSETLYDIISVLVKVSSEWVTSKYLVRDNKIIFNTAPLSGQDVKINYTYLTNTTHTTGVDVLIDYEFIEEMIQRSDIIMTLKNNKFVTSNNPNGEIKVMLKNYSDSNNNSNIIDFNMELVRVKEE